MYITHLEDRIPLFVSRLFVFFSNVHAVFNMNNLWHHLVARDDHVL
jgi:hypothetical protein